MSNPATLPGGDVLLGPFRLDWERLALHDAADLSQKLTPKAAAVLAQLLAQPGRTLSRQALFDAVWPGSFSNDEVLTTVINELRRAFADSPRQPAYIETVPKLGYRWCGPVPIVPVADAATAQAADSPAEDDPPATASSHSLAAWSARWRRGRRLGAHGWEPYALALATVVSLSLLLVWLRSGQVPVAPSATAPSANVALARPELTTVSTAPGLEVDPDWFVDGRRFVYARQDADAAPQLWLGELGEESRLLPTATDGQPSAPAAAPDGRAVAYLWRTGSAGCELRVMELDSTSVRTLADGCPPKIETSLDWSPDGRSLVFTRHDPRHASLAGRHPALFMVGVDGRGLRRLSQAGRWLTVDLHPRFSPDGQRIAFIRDGDGQRQLLHLRASDGGDETAVPIAMWAYRTDWLDARQLIVSGHGAAPAELWQVALDGTRVARLAADGLGPGFSVHPRSRQVLVEQRRHDDNIWRRSASDPQLAPEQLTTSTRNERDPRIAPDGALLAMMVEHGGGFEVDLLEITSGTRRQLTTVAPRSVLDLRWAGDGAALALVLGTEHGKRLGVVALDGALRNLPASLSDLPLVQLEFDPAGRRLLLLVGRDGRRELLGVDWPELARPAELLADFSVAAVSLDRSRGEVWLSRAQDGHRFALQPDGQLRSLPPVLAPVMPSDHWSVDAGQLFSAVRGSPGTSLALRALDSSGVPRFELHWRAPEPPLGRPFDLHGGWLWYAQRDRDESDLVRLRWP